jgi:putative PIN family toxin of toxin-antitoxin system
LHDASAAVIEAILAIVTDTNLWISGLINARGAPARVLDAALAGRVRLIFSNPLLAELHDGIRRDRIRRRIPLNDQALERYLAAITRGSSVVEIDGTVRLCRDPKDDIVIEMAIKGGAQLIVSRDEDLTRDLALVDVLQVYGIEVLTVARFLERLDADSV